MFSNDIIRVTNMEWLLDREIDIPLTIYDPIYFWDWPFGFYVSLGYIRTRVRPTGFMLNIKDLMNSIGDDYV